ncbi:MAG: PQQ-binding-like beta-propeller repeat protein [Acidobacteria bacterium]|nr:PQQ-binding-like beta-propeller repeat protein [Acidobacteriota bacterium]
MTAFDAASGAVRWSWDGDGPAYGSPMLFELGGTRQVVVFTQEHFVGVSPETGTLLWSRPFTTPAVTTSQTPLLHEDMVIQTGRANGVTAFRVSPGAGGWTTEDVWHTDEVGLHMTNGVINDGVLYGLSHLNSGQYFGLDLDTGEVLWTSAPRQAENASILRSGDTILSLEDDAELVVLAHSRSGFSPVQRYEVADSETWTAPTLVGNRLFIKDISTLALWTLD